MIDQSIRKPSWLRKTLCFGEGFEKTKNLLAELPLSTVCQEAVCPNMLECYRKGTATFLIMGDRCTRNCSFCAISSEKPVSLDPEEPGNVAKALKTLDLDYAVITSVTRDDLADGGAEHFAKTVFEVRHLNPDTKIELLIPDFKGSSSAIETVVNACPDVLNHNLETVSRLYHKVRPGADYRRSLKILKEIKSFKPNIVTKSGIMVGLGEDKNEVSMLFDDLLAVGCDILTIGQYLRPDASNFPVAEYVRPDAFEAYEKEARRKGFKAVASAPFVRSSFGAKELYKIVATAQLAATPTHTSG